jgi:hypothetical protein
MRCSKNFHIVIYLFALFITFPAFSQQTGPKGNGNANVYFNGSGSLYCFWSNKLIQSNEYGSYHAWCATNEDPTPVEELFSRESLKTWQKLLKYKFYDYESCLSFCNWRRKIIGMPTLKASPEGIESMRLYARERLNQSSTARKTESKSQKCQWCGNRFTGLGYSIYYNGEIIVGTIKDYALVGNYPGNYCTRKCAFEAKKSQ